ncbi:6-phosphogluconolactonase [Leifsonia xyli subsp. xyli str. CTCB07]|uniref:6-phosphogluconolactonase n=2 Tax=Leifsonia xyli subsp. xyli TaxID=59736 RepID=Q6AF40_LEIXX|nr:6-phosphogluconolactonase [Leifsonia xyli subsp. xyli str. CTCB07]
MGIAVLEAVNASLARDTIDWSKVHFWWGDERFVERESRDRNERQAREALLDYLDVPAENIHPFPAEDDIPDIDEAVRVFAAELEAFAPDGELFPKFDITFLGVGPDGHIASLFPDRPGIRETEATVIAEREAPKPPPQRLSLTRPVLNASDRIWLVLAGSDKASALGLALAGASYTEVPVAGAKGRKRTVFFVDLDAAVEVPENLIAPSY